MPAAVKEQIADTFLSLVEHKSVDKVTVKELVDLCGISRQTFYYHFNDILEVIDWVIDRQSNRILAASLKEDTPEKAIGVFVSSVTKNREGIRHGLASAKGPYIEKALYQSLRTYLDTLSRTKGYAGTGNQFDQEVALQFCAGGIIGVLLVYCETQPVDEQRLSKQLACYLQAVRLSFQS